MSHIYIQNIAAYVEEDSDPSAVALLVKVTRHLWLSPVLSSKLLQMVSGGQ